MKRLLQVALLASTALYWSGCGGGKPAVVAAAAPPSPPAAPTTPAIKPADELVATGPLIVEHQVDVVALRDGIVAATVAEPGTRVRQGQLIGQLDDRQIAADLAAAQAKTSSIAADLQNWKAEAKVLDADYARSKKMWDAGLITQEQLEHARYKSESDNWDVKRVEQLLVNAQESQRSLELELEKTRIRAPFAGVVARRYVRAGQRVAIGDRLFWVTAEAPLRVRFTLPEKMIGHVRKGQEVAVTSPDVGDGGHKARVLEVSPVVDPASGTIEVLAQLEGRSGALRPGMTAMVHIAAQP